MNTIKYLLLIVAFIISSKAYSQDFEVSPVKIDFNAEPGESQTKTFTVKNHSNTKTPILISVGDYIPTSKGDKKYLPANASKNSLAGWVNISPTYFELNPNEEQIINLTMQTPLDDYSSRWGLIYVTSAREQEAFGVDEGIGAGLNVSSRIVIQVTQSPISNTNYIVKISNLTEVTEETDNMRKFTANIDNLGDKITRCKVYLVASNLKTAEEKTFEAKIVETYPKSASTIELDLPNELAKGQYSLAAILDYGSNTALEGTQIIIEVP